MRKQRSFSPEFKRQVIEELLSGVGTPAQICRRHEISSGLLYYWKKQYGREDLASNGKREAALEERICQLEQMLGKACLENEFLKRALQRTLGPSKRRDSSLPTTETCSKPSRGGASS
jgi:transposase-like protein